MTAATASRGLTIATPCSGPLDLGPGGSSSRAFGPRQSEAVAAFSNFPPGSAINELLQTPFLLGNPAVKAPHLAEQQRNQLIVLCA